VPNLLYAYLFLSAFLVSLILVPAVRRFAIRLGIVDDPGERKVHHTRKALLGGLAVYLAFYLIIGLNLVLGATLGPPSWLSSDYDFLRRMLPFPIQLDQLRLIFIGSTMIMLIGLADDIKGTHFSYKVKFLVQFCAAFLVVSGGMRTQFMPGTALNYLISILWIVGITNSFNLLDNMDGLSAGVALISALVLFLVVSGQGQFAAAMVLLVYAGSVLGFLYYNFNPSTIFMGDAGSLFIGFLLAVFTIANSYVIPESSSLLQVIMPVLILSIPLFDTFSVIYIRLRDGRPVFVGDTNHLSHRLVKLGLSHREAVLLIYAMSLCIGISATLLPALSVIQSIVILCQAALIYIMITVLMIMGGKVKNRSESVSSGGIE